MRQKQLNEGFSLLELSIALIVLSLLLLPALQFYKIYRMQVARDNTRANLATIQSAVGDFFLKNGYYPCPADRTLSSASILYGSGQCGVISALGLGTCSAGNGFCHTTGNTEAPNPNIQTPPLPPVAISPNIMVGGVPFADLGIPMDTALDGWGRMMSYAVTESLTAQATFNRNQGAIKMNRFNAAQYVAGAVQYESDTGTYTQNVHFILVSHGEDGSGAFNANGTQFAACAAGNADSENCDNNGVFFDPTLTVLGMDATGPITAGNGKIAGGFYYDDIISYSSDVPTGLWFYSPVVNHENDIVTYHNVGIGAMDVGTLLNNDPDKTAQVDGFGNLILDSSIALDVKNNLTADNVRTSELCDMNGNDCFSIEALGGNPGTDNIDCTGSVMTGIANGAGTCEPMLPPSMISACPPGQVADRIVGGTVQCKVFP